MLLRGLNRSRIFKGVISILNGVRSVDHTSSTFFRITWRIPHASLKTSLLFSRMILAPSELIRLYASVYMRSPGSWLTPFTKRLIQQSIALAHDAQRQLVHRHAYDTTYPFETPAKLLQRLINSIMLDHSGTKKGIVYYIGNQLFRCYFKVSSSWTNIDGRSIIIECVGWSLKRCRSLPLRPHPWEKPIESRLNIILDGTSYINCIFERLGRSCFGPLIIVIFKPHNNYGIP